MKKSDLDYTEFRRSSRTSRRTEKEIISIFNVDIELRKAISGHMQVGQWYHVVVEFKDGQQSVFLDGKLLNV